MTTPALRIGARGSPLALAQAHETRDRLIAAHPGLAEPGATEIVAIETVGDKILDRPLSDVGGKGLFTKELEAALLDGRADLAVHSMKDVETALPDGLEIACILPRADARDALLTRGPDSLDALPDGAVVGTASLRRRAIVRSRRPKLRIETLRGNVQTRMRKLSDGEVDATLLAVAGLRRLGLLGHATAILEPEDMLPAVGQGAIGVEIRSDDDRTRELLRGIHDENSARRVAAERACLAVLDGSCRTPIAGLAEIAGGQLSLRALIARPDGSETLTANRSGADSEAEAIGRAVGEDLKSRAAPDFFATV